jgi:hypothetical protein
MDLPIALDSVLRQERILELLKDLAAGRHESRIEAPIYL